MSIFEEALRKGLKASADASAARREINEVLTAAAADVAKVLGVEVSFYLYPFRGGVERRTRVVRIGRA